MQVLSEYISSNMREHAIFIKNGLSNPLSVLNTLALISILKRIVLEWALRFVWKVEEIVTGETYRTYGHVSGWMKPTPFL